MSTATIQYVWSAVYIDAMILRDRSTMNNGTLDERLWVQQDANYNVTALVNGSGTVVERDVYDPYGKGTVLNATWGTLSGSAYGWIYLHQGGRYDTISVLYHFRFRELLPQLGRWDKPDPIGLAGHDADIYRYVSNSPTNRTDPTGLDEYTVSGIVTDGGWPSNPPHKPEPLANIKLTVTVKYTWYTLQGVVSKTKDYTAKTDNQGKYTVEVDIYSKGKWIEVTTVIAEDDYKTDRPGKYKNKKGNTWPDPIEPDTTLGHKKCKGEK